MPQKAYFLKNANIVNEGRTFRGSLVLKSGLIERIIHESEQADFSKDSFIEMDLEGLTVIPGVIDDQVHFREPGLTHKGDIESESRAAVAGGVTSFMEMPNTSPQCTSLKLLEDKFSLASGKSLANHSFYIGATNDNISELKAAEADHVCGVKIFMGSSTGNMLVDNPDSLRSIFREVKLPVAVHCEDEATVRKNLDSAVQIYGEDIPHHMHAAIRSHNACELSSRLAVGLAERFGTRLHLLHLSTARELSLLENENRAGEKQITAEVCVHHLWFDIDDYSRLGSRIKWNPSIKYKSDRLGLIEGIKNGYVDIIATDHAPHTLEEKGRPYTSCPSGAPMVQHSLPAMLSLGNKHGIDIEKVVELMCHNPAVCFNVKNRGFIREGYAADLAVVDTRLPQKVNDGSVHYKCAWTPLNGARLDASVMYTFINGNIVYEKGRIYDDKKGSPLEFSR